MGGKLTWLILLGTGAVALVAGIDALRGSGSPTQTTPPTETTTPRATTPEQVETDPPAHATFSPAALDAAIRERFDALGHEPWWYGHITGIKKTAHEGLKVATDLDPDDSETAVKICSAVIKFAFDFGLESVAVVASDGRTGGGCA